jgi:hypothetical protein
MYKACGKSEARITGKGIEAKMKKLFLEEVRSS